MGIEQIRMNQQRRFNVCTGGKKKQKLNYMHGGWPGLHGLEFVDMGPVRGYHFSNSRESRESEGAQGSAFWYMGLGLACKNSREHGDCAYKPICPAYEEALGGR